ncbi:hypothetical protein OG500_17560 [Kitasatospora sp. NBC_01250]|uniref:hypothetical protein n=1 Tax=unclassified Kitasatospora TaxID=2633591 RepID=UPI002E0FE10A|nr:MULTISPECIES: hypothetical protein [unclassified Kitasatospora]WSJ67966.1 hypothetical protein OG294_18615 [Kitasatospora sp. NBC_01302]
MATFQKFNSAFPVNRRLLGAGLMLGGVGAAAGLLGTVLVGVALATAGRSWVQQFETSPGERAARALQQARAASQAGLDAWRTASVPDGAQLN